MQIKLIAVSHTASLLEDLKNNINLYVENRGLCRQVENVGAVQPVVEEAPLLPQGSFPYLKGLQESCRGAFDKVM